MKASNFTLPSTSQNNYSLKNSIGKYVVLYFYPKDDTPGCTTQACNIRDNYAALNENEIQIIGISADSEASHLKFTNKYQLPFPLMADNSKEIINFIILISINKRVVFRTFYKLRQPPFARNFATIVLSIN